MDSSPSSSTGTVSSRPSSVHRIISIDIHLCHTARNTHIARAARVKTWRHPQNRKYITYRIAVGRGPSHGDRLQVRKFGEILTYANGQTNKRTDKQIYRQYAHNTSHAWRGKSNIGIKSSNVVAQRSTKLPNLVYSMSCWICRSIYQRCRRTGLSISAVLLSRIRKMTKLNELTFIISLRRFSRCCFKEAIQRHSYRWIHALTSWRDTSGLSFQWTQDVNVWHISDVNKATSHKAKAKATLLPD